jgi:transcriptional regulator with XRE-family HTH domain
MNSMEISNYLEKIRYARKLSQEDFVDGIVSMRQYQRYRSGECELTYEKLEQFANRLAIPTKKLMYEFEREIGEQYKTITLFYNAVVNRDDKLAIELRSKIEQNKIVDEDRLLIYKHGTMLQDFYAGRISKAEMIAKTSELVDYPAILKQKFFLAGEVLILSSLLNYTEGDEMRRILRKMNEIFEEELVISGENDTTLSLILMRLGKAFGIQKNNVKVLQFCDLGIKRGIEMKSYYLMEYFFYFKALAHFKLQSFDLYEDALFNCYNVLHLEENKKKIEKFTKLIEEDFHINFDGFVINFLKKKTG